MVDHSKVGKKNVAKSKTHERRIANLFSAWFGVKQSFRRRRTEGRESNVIDIERTGDIIPACPEWAYFNIEAKSGKNPTLDALLSNPEGTTLTKWWHQSNYDAGLATKSYNNHHPGDPKTILPLVVFKPHQNHDWMMISTKCLSILKPKISNQTGWVVKLKDVPGLEISLKDARSQYDAIAFYNQKNGINSTDHPHDVTPIFNNHHGDGLWFPHLLFDWYSRHGEIFHNVSHTKNKKNEVIVPLLLDDCFICRWKDFASNISPESFFIKWPAHLVEAKPEH